jgi:hypothetical protein
MGDEISATIGSKRARNVFARGHALVNALIRFL